MAENPVCLRLPEGLRTRVRREAAQHGMTRSSWMIHLLERGQLVEELQSLVPKDHSPTAGAGSPSGLHCIPVEVIERLLFAACFSEALLKRLNATLNRSSSELGLVAQAARDSAQAETATLLKQLQGAH